jgi:hypothetical protein
MLRIIYFVGKPQSCPLFGLEPGNSKLKGLKMQHARYGGSWSSQKPIRAKFAKSERG